MRCTLALAHVLTETTTTAADVVINVSYLTVCLIAVFDK